MPDDSEEKGLPDPPENLAAEQDCSQSEVPGSSSADPYSPECLIRFAPTQSDDSIRLWGLSRFWRSLAFIGGVIAPVVCFLSAASEGGSLSIDQPWQDGSLDTYCRLLTTWPAVAPFYPFLLFSMASLSLVLWDRDRFSRVRLIRFGLYAGVPLSVQYFYLVFAPTLNPIELIFVFLSMAIATAIGTVVLVLVAKMLSLLGWKRGPWIVFGLLFLISAIATDVNYRQSGSISQALSDTIPAVIVAPFLILYVACLVCGCVWCILIYSVNSWQVWKQSKISGRQFTLKQLFGLMTWTAAYFAAWRLSINLMLVEYAMLPTKDPNCFVCTAAARGRRRVVGSELIVSERARILIANDQMRWLKAAELVLRSSAPSLHRALRRVYNRIGPILASRITNSLSAELAYRTLQPASWAARLVLSVLLPDRGRVVLRLYRR